MGLYHRSVLPASGPEAPASSGSVGTRRQESVLAEKKKKKSRISPEVEFSTGLVTEDGGGERGAERFRV